MYGKFTCWTHQCTAQHTLISFLIWSASSSSVVMEKNEVKIANKTGERKKKRLSNVTLVVVPAKPLHNQHQLDCAIVCCSALPDLSLSSSLSLELIALAHSQTHKSYGRGCDFSLSMKVKFNMISLNWIEWRRRPHERVKREKTSLK